MGNPAFVSHRLIAGCHMTPAYAAFTGFCSTGLFAVLIYALVDRLPHWSWRTFIVCMDLLAVAITEFCVAIIVYDIVRKPWFTFGLLLLTGPGGIVVLMRSARAAPDRQHSRGVREALGGSHVMCRKDRR